MAAEPKKCTQLASRWEKIQRLQRAQDSWEWKAGFTLYSTSWVGHLWKLRGHSFGLASPVSGKSSLQSDPTAPNQTSRSPDAVISISTFSPALAQWQVLEDRDLKPPLCSVSCLSVETGW